MTVCANEPWQIELTKDSDLTKIFLTFDAVTIVGGVITGKVVDNAGNRTPLTGTCSPSVGEPEASDMTFTFIVINDSGSPIQIRIVGLGYQRVVAQFPDFKGGFVAFRPLTPIPADLKLLAPVDTGDTGTASGTQT